ncbi:Transcriptional regulatory protein, C terminal [Saccharopolyspora kobensis]|uniref:Transcriptional regulatory protein, C terminal n=1 Tax=Saccharopolyspora kobensis TaxID=146035 RepID=A0A1H5XJ74_9PSEU|nr:winged helix-turn-helix domain-containing protein [Saccharopolyspora kobensis]SEG11782.1 Transcriptional regulatory protein, C terminal [Saccharopolyspora kobensis]SFE41963.1 Transcriptional regulatory protein, C terminal [Saccharopolyspora kobensis]
MTSEAARPLAANSFETRPLQDGAVVEVTARFIVTRQDLAALERVFTAQPDRGVPHQSAVEVPRLRSLPAPEEPKLQILVAPRRILRADGSAVQLTRLEFDLLLYLCENPGRVHRRSALLNAVWQFNSMPSTRTVDVHIRRIRSKLGTGLDLITTVRGVGYRMDRTTDVQVVRD